MITKLKQELILVYSMNCDDYSVLQRLLNVKLYIVKDYFYDILIDK